MDAIIGTGKLSRRQHGVIAERDVMVPVSAGFDIAVDLFRPDSNGKFPALLSISPYPKEMQSDRRWPRGTATTIFRGVIDALVEAGPTDFFVRRGYVHIIGNVRGTNKSGGTYRWLDHGEVRDVYDVIEWAAKQPWCNGNVGMMGISYFAWIQVFAAGQQPPHLKCICPLFGATDQYRDAWYHGGILSANFMTFLLAPDDLDVHSEAIVACDELGEKKFKEALELALADKDINVDPRLVASLKEPDRPVNAAMVDVLLHPVYGPYWKERTELAKRIKIPAYLGSCWANYTLHLPGSFRCWANMKGPKKMVIGPPYFVDRPFYQYAWEMLRFYDYYLKEIDTGIMDEPAVKIFVMGANEWKMAETWPLPGTRWIPFNLHAGGILCEIEPWPDAPCASYIDSPSQRGSLKYYSPRLVENTEVIGPIALNLYASCRGTDINFFVTLWDVDPQGNEELLTRGWLKASHRKIDPNKSKPWQPFHTHTNPTPLVPGRVYEFNIEVLPTANLFKAGHRFCLKISGADNEPPETMIDLHRAGHLSRQTPSVVTIFHDANHPSHLLLPITRGNIVGTFLSGGDLSIRDLKMT
ncbi:CocE/NonD family hydrolase [Chloroflexota bacterium]